ncbi:hypothetical protein HY993_00005 [Candidatus Micrarchaeota archaeon]|nr:hypothetical protein [Candidatus Micrarchaeota archaeon]
MSVAKKAVLATALFGVLSRAASAHCPLCTAGIVAAAGGAAVLGVNTLVIGLFVGGFAVSTGAWAANALLKKASSAIKNLVALASFLLTVLPATALIPPSYYPVGVFWFGDYGGLFNQTYIIDKFLVGSIIGGAIVFAAPSISKLVTKARGGKTIVFQGVGITLLLLVTLGAILQLLA